MTLALLAHLAGERKVRRVSSARCRQGTPADHRARARRLGTLLQRHESLWRPRPYVEHRPGWCDTHSDLENHLLALSDGAVDFLLADHAALIELIAAHEGDVAEIATLIDLPQLHGEHEIDVGHRTALDIPGAKLAQIRAFAATVGVPLAPVLEWCAGKGHLGRLLALECASAVLSADHDQRLCQEGHRLAQRAGSTTQQFACTNVLQDGANLLEGRHAVALHACGDLHLALILAAGAAHVPALDVVPCCHHKTAAEYLGPMSGVAGPVLSREERRLAVSDAVTASPRELALRRRQADFRAGFCAVLEDFAPQAAERRGVVRLATKNDFMSFCRDAATRLQVVLPDRVDWAAYERAGHERVRRAARLSLVRQAFRRALEVWMVLDRAVLLEDRGYAVRVGTFCPRSLTPRNLMLSARRCES